MSEHNHVIEKDGEVFSEKVNHAIASMDSGKKEQILRDFNEFKSYLGKRIELGATLGLNEEHMAVVAEKVAGYLAAHEDPRNSEEKLLQELWKVGNEEQRHILAHLLVRLAQPAN
jgi:exosome complex RNA-binding protein Rrp42 (RNase PH superfamily)